MALRSSFSSSLAISCHKGTGSAPLGHRPWVPTPAGLHPPISAGLGLIRGPSPSGKTSKFMKSNRQSIPTAATRRIIQVGEDLQDHRVQWLTHPHHARSQTTRFGKGFQAQAQPQPIPARPPTVGPSATRPQLLSTSRDGVTPPSWAAVSVHHHSFGEVVSSNNQPDPLPAQCEAITSCPIAATREQRTTPTSAHPPFGEL